MDQRGSSARARRGAVSRRGLTAALCAGVMLAATVAWIVGHDISSRYSYETFDRLVGGSGIVAVVLATIALPWAGWARLPLLATIALSALMAYARFSEPSPDDIDLTPFYFPPLIFVLAGSALIMVAMAPPDESRHQKS